MDPRLSEEDVARLVGRLVLSHELELRRQETVLGARLRQLQADLDAAHRELADARRDPADPPDARAAR